MDIMDAIKGRRSIRKYTEKNIPDDILQTLLEAARWAPSWSNTQCWRFIVIRDRETKSKLADTLKGTRPGRANPATEAIRSAPVLIAACAELGLSGFYKVEDDKSQPATDKGDYWYMFDVALAVHNMSLAAHAVGLGTVHTGLLDAVEAGKILNLPGNVKLVELIPLGWPDEQPAPRPRKEVSEFVFYGKFPR